MEKLQLGRTGHMTSVAAFGEVFTTAGGHGDALTDGRRRRDWCRPPFGAAHEGPPLAAVVDPQDVQAFERMDTPVRVKPSGW